MTHCRVEKRIWRDRDEKVDFTCVYYELDVGDAPARGTELADGRWFSGPLTAVIWNSDAERFNCRVEDEEPCFDRDYDYSHEFLLENALMQGWQLCDQSEVQ